MRQFLKGTFQGEERVERVRAAVEAWYRERAALKLPPPGSTASRACWASTRKKS